MADVTIYTRKFCGFCTAAKRLLDKKGVEYRELDATFDPGLRSEMVKKSEGGSTFPQILIDGVPIGGCDDLHALDKAGQLDAMLAG